VPAPVERISLAGLVADAIRRLHLEAPIRDLVQPG
jgi:hypothetical protein